MVRSFDLISLDREPVIVYLFLGGNDDGAAKMISLYNKKLMYFVSYLSYFPSCRNLLSHDHPLKRNREVSRRQQTSESTRMNALVSEVKARRAARPAGTTADRIGGVLIGDKGREMAKDGTISVRKAETPKKVEEKSWYRKFI